MGRFILKAIIVFFLFLLAVTYLSEPESAVENHVPANEPRIVIQSADLYNQNDQSTNETWSNQTPPKKQHESVTYQISQFIEQSGLFLYEGIITIVTDLANII